MVFQIHKGFTDKNIQLNVNLVTVLDHGIKAVKHKWDFCGVIDGPEGSGKTNTAVSCAYYVTHTLSKAFSVDNILFTPQQIMEAIDNAKKMDVFVLDEFILSGYSVDALSSVQNVMVKKFTVVRKKQLFFFMVIPYLHMLRAYFARDRTNFLIHMWSPDGIKRGEFRFYGPMKKLQYYYQSKKYMGKPVRIKADFSGHFHENMSRVIDLQDYDDKKEEALKSIQLKIPGEKKGEDDPKSESGTSLRCNDCGSESIYYRASSDSLVCRKCGYTWEREESKLETTPPKLKI